MLIAEANAFDAFVPVTVNANHITEKPKTIYASP